jgi:formiminoglutamase
MGVTCAPAIATAAKGICNSAAGYTTTVNGRFKGGWPTRQYGQHSSGIHAIQLELAQSIYLQDEAAPWTYDHAKAARLRPHLTKILTALAELTPTLGGTS